MRNRFTPFLVAGLLTFVSAVGCPALDAPGPLTPNGLTVDRGGKGLVYRNADGTPGYGSLMNALPSGRKAVEQGDTSDLCVKILGGGVCRSLFSIFSDNVYAIFYGVVADYNFSTSTGTDNTAALLQAIAAAQTGGAQGQGKRLVLPPGAILTGPLPISGQIVTDGSASHATTLVLKTGSTAALFPVKPTGGYNFTGAGYPQGNIAFRNLRITSQGGRGATATPSDPQAGFDFQSGGAWSAWARLDNVTVYNMPGSGLKAAGWVGMAECVRCYFKTNGGFGVDTNTTNDWSFLNGNWDGNLAGNHQSSGDTGLFILNPNNYSSPDSGLILYNTDAKIVGGSFDHSGKAGLSASFLDLSKRVTVAGTNFGTNSLATAGGYGDIDVNGPAGRLSISGAFFPDRPFSVDATKKIANNIRFVASSGVTLSVADTVFASGSIAATSVTNGPFSQIQVVGPNDNRLLGTTIVRNAAQYGGVFMQNASGTVMSMAAYGANGDFGGIVGSRADGSVLGFQIIHPSAGIANFVNSSGGLFTFGNGASSATPQSNGIKGTDGTGTDIAGAALSVNGGRGTGAGAGGDVLIQTAPAGATGSAVNTYQEQAKALAGGGFRSRLLTRSAAPTATDLPAGLCGFVKNTGDGSLKAYCNDGGTLKATAALN